MNVMIIPAAGRGTRLSYDGPKLLYPLDGKPLLYYLIERYKPYVDQFVLVINPTSEALVLDAMNGLGVNHMIDYQVQATGMLDAITAPMESLRNRDKHEKIDTVWVSWCDQVSISAETAKSLQNELSKLAAESERGYLSEFMALPTAMVKMPYIHMKRNNQGNISQVLQRRESDPMPDIGENDCGLFAMSGVAYFDALRKFASIDQTMGHETKERNFLPFIAWLNNTAPVSTFPVHSDIETVGINTVEDAKKILETWEMNS